MELGLDIEHHCMLWLRCFFTSSREVKVYLVYIIMVCFFHPVDILIFVLISVASLQVLEVFMCGYYLSKHCS